MGKFFLLALALVACVVNVNAGTLASSTVAPTSAVAGVSTTITLEYTPDTDVIASGSVSFGLTGFALGTSPSCSFAVVNLTGAAVPATVAPPTYSNGILVVKVDKQVNKNKVTITCTNIINPITPQAAIASGAGIAVRIYTSADGTGDAVDSSADTTLVAITGITVPSVAVANNFAGATTSITIKFTPTIQFTNTGKLTFGLPNFTLGTTPLCTFAAPASVTTKAVTVVTGTSGAGIFFQVDFPAANGDANPAVDVTCTNFVVTSTVQAATANIVIKTVTSAGVVLESTGIATLTAILPVITLASVTVTTNVATFTSSITVEFTPTTAIVATGKVHIALAGFGLGTSPSCTFTAPAAAAATPTISGTDAGTNFHLIVGISVANTAGAKVTFTCTNIKVPTTFQAAKTNIVMKTTLADGTTFVDGTASGSLTKILSALTGAKVDVTTNPAGSTSSISVEFTPQTATVATAKVTIALPGFSLGTSPSCTFTAPAATVATPTFSGSGATFVLIVGISVANTAASKVTFSCTNIVVTSTAQAAKTNIVMKTTAADGTTDVDTSLSAALTAITGVLGAAGVTLFSNLQSTATTATISFTPVQALATTATAEIILPSFALGTLACSVVVPSTITGVAGASSNTGAATATITLTLTGTVAAGVKVTVTCTGVTTPLAQGNKSDIVMKTKQGVVIVDTTSAATLPTIEVTADSKRITEAAVTLSSNIASATTTVTFSFKTVTAFASGGQILVTLTSYTSTAVPVCTFTSPSALKNTAAFVDGTKILTVTLDNTLSPAAGLYTFSCTGPTNPALRAAISSVSFVTKTFDGATTYDSTQLGTLPQIVGALSGTSVVLSNSNAGNLATTVTVSFTTFQIIPLAGKISTTLTGFSWPATPVCTTTTDPVKDPVVTGTAFFLNNILTVTIAGSAIAAADKVAFTCTGATNPSAQLSKTDVVIKTTKSDNTDIDASISASLSPVWGAISGGAVTLSSTAANTDATRVTVSFSTVQKIPASGKIVVALTNFETWTPVCKFTAPTGTADPTTAGTTGTGGLLTLTLTDKEVAVGLITFTCTGAKTPSAQSNKNDVSIKTQTSTGTVDVDVSTTATLPTINLTSTLLTNTAVTLSNNIAAADKVTVSVTFNAATAISAGGKILVYTTGFTYATPVCTFTAPSTLANTVASDATVLTITLGATVTAAAGVVTFTCTNAVVPALISAARSTVQIVTKSSADANIDSTQVGTMPQITGAITNAAVTISDQTASKTATTVTVTFTTAQVLPASGKILTTLTGFSWPKDPVCLFTGTAAPAAPAKSIFADNTLTVTIAATAIAASATTTFTCTGATLASAQAAKTDVAVKTQSSASANIDASITGSLQALWGTLTGAAVTLSSATAAASSVTVTTTFTAIQAIVASGKIVVPLTGFSFGTAACAFTAPSGTAAPASSVYAGSDLTVTLSATAIPIGVVTFTCTGATNPSASKLALTDVNIKTTTAADATIDRTVAGSLVAITPTSGSLGETKITLSNTAAAATSVVVSATFIAAQALPANGQIKLTLTGFAAASPVCNITKPSELANSAAFATNVLTITVTAGAAAGSTFTFSCTGFTNPATQGALTNVAVNTANAAGTALDSTAAGSLVAVTAVGALTGAAITLSTGSASETAVTVTTSFTSATTISASSTIVVPLTGFAFTDLACAFTAPSGTAAPTKSAFASGVLTVTVSAVAIDSGLTTFTCTGASNPTAAQVAKTDVVIYTRGSTGTDIDRSTTGTLPAITAVGAVTGAAVTLSSAVAAATAVTVTTTLTTATAITASGKIVVPLTGYAFTAVACAFTAPTGTAAPTAAYANSALTVTISATAIAAGVVTFTCTGATNPASQVALTNLNIRTTTSADVLIDTTKTGSLVAITPAAGSLGGAAVTLSNAAAAATGVTVTTTFVASVAVPASGQIKVTLTGFTASSPVCTFTSPSALANTVAFATSILTVTVTAGAAAGSTFTFGCTGFTNPATQAALTNVAINTANAAGTALDSTATGKLVAVSAVGALTGAAITLSSTSNGATAVTVSTTFTAASALAASAKISVSLANFAFPATPVCTFTAPAVTVNTAAFASGTLTVTLGSAASIAASAVTFSCTGATNPGAQAALTNVTVTTTTSTGTDSDRSTTGSLVAIVVAVAKVSFKTQPSGAVPATKFTTQPVVELQDGTGAVVTAATDNVILSIKSQAAGISGALSGTTTVKAVAGVATFTDVAVSLANTNYILTATSGTFTADSSSFNAVAAGTATALAFSTQPSSTASSGTSFTAQPVVELRDNAGTKTTSTASVTLAIKTSTVTATLSGTATVSAVAGVATFSGLSLSAAGSFTLEATSAGLTSVISTSIVVSAATTGSAKLYFSTVPGLFATVAKSFTFAAGFQKADASTDKTATAAVTLTSSPAGLATNNTIVTPTAGIASFSVSYATEGTYTITVSATGYTSASRSIMVQRAATAATKLVFSTQPSSTTRTRLAFTVQPIVTVQDATGITVTSSTAIVTLTATGLGPIAALSATANAGAAEFSTLYLESAVSTATVTLTASSPLLTSATSTAIVISRTFAYIAFSKFPTFETSAINFTVQPTVTAYSSDALVFITQVGSIVLSSPSTGLTLTATPTTGLTATMTAGVASWTGVKATVAAAGTFALTATMGTSIAYTNQLSLYTTAAAASTAKATEQFQSVQFNVKINLDASNVDNAVKKAQTEAAIAADFCLAASLPILTCGMQVTIKKASVSADVVILNSADSTRPSPAKIASALSAQLTDSTSVLRNSPTVGLIENPTALVVTNSALKSSSASTTSVAVATTAVVAGVAAALLL